MITFSKILNCFWLAKELNFLECKETCMEVCPIGTTRRLFQVACRDGILPVIPAIWQENCLSLGNFLIKYSQKIQKDVIILI